jgi:hypothetical protein
MGTDQWQSQVRLLREVVAAVLPTSSPSRESPHSGGGAELSGEFLAAWYHAHRFVSTAAAVGADADALFDRVRSRDDRVDTLFAAHDVRRDVAHPGAVSYERLLVAGLQHSVLGTRLAEQAPALPPILHSVLTTGGTEGTAPAVSLLRDLRGHSNLLRTWLPLAREDDGSITVGDVVVVPSAFAPDVVLSEALDVLAVDPFRPEGWGLIKVVAGTDPLSGTAAERFAQIAADLNVPALLRRLGSMAWLAADRLARQSLNPEDQARRQRLRDALLAAVREDREGARNATSPRSGDNLSDVQRAVLEGMYVLAGAETDPAELMRAFASDLSALGRTDASYLRQFRGLVEELVRTRPLVEAHALTAVLGESRAA